MQYDCQDWTPVVIHNKAKKKEVKQNPAGTKEFAKLNDNDIPMLDKMTPAQATALQEARKAKGLSQADFAKSLNIDVSIIKDYESCKVVKFNLRFYKSLMRKLGVIV